MKSNLTLLLLVFLFLGSKAQQITNGGFENWTDSLAPDGWCTLESIFQPVGSIVINGLSSKETNNPYQGNQSLSLKTDSIITGTETKIVNVPGTGDVEVTIIYKALQSGIVSLGTATYSAGAGVKFAGISFPFRPDTISFAYKYKTIDKDTAAVYLNFKKTNNANIINGIIPIKDTSSSWKTFNFPLTGLYNGVTPDSILIQFFSSVGKGKKGSNFIIDGLRFGYVSLPTLIEEIKSNVTSYAYPSPASTNVSLSISQITPSTTVMVYDINGRVMTHEFLEGLNHDINVSNWPVGIYNYALIDDGKTISKGKFAVSK